MQTVINCICGSNALEATLNTRRFATIATTKASGYDYVSNDWNTLLKYGRKATNSWSTFLHVGCLSLDSGRKTVNLRLVYKVPPTCQEFNISNIGSRN